MNDVNDAINPDLNSAISRAADRARSKIRSKIREIRSAYLAAGKSPPPDTDANAYAGYIKDCLLGVISKHFPDLYILKGGTLLRHWYPGSPRPTMDLDLAALDIESLDWSPFFMSQQIRSVVHTADFMAETGLVFDEQALSGDAIKPGKLNKHWRFSGTVSLGVPKEKGSAHIKFCVEIGVEDIPKEMRERIEFASFIDEQDIPIQAIKPEFSVADKLHAIITRGLSNGRLKDFYDVANFFKIGVDPALVLSSFRQVCKINPGISHERIPISATDILGLTKDYIDAHTSLWEKRWREWTGGYFDPNTDLSLYDAVSLIKAWMYGVGLIKRDKDIESAEKIFAKWAKNGSLSSLELSYDEKMLCRGLGLQLDVNNRAWLHVFNRNPIGDPERGAVSEMQRKRPEKLPNHMKETPEAVISALNLARDSKDVAVWTTCLLKACLRSREDLDFKLPSDCLDLPNVPVDVLNRVWSNKAKKYNVSPNLEEAVGMIPIVDLTPKPRM